MGATKLRVGLRTHTFNVVDFAVEELGIDLKKLGIIKNHLWIRVKEEKEFIHVKTFLSMFM